MMMMIIIIIIIIIIYSHQTLNSLMNFLYISSPCTGPEKLWGLQEFEASRIPVRGWFDPWTRVRPAGCSKRNRTRDLRACSEVSQPTAPPLTRFSFLILRSLSLPHNHLISLFLFLLFFPVSGFRLSYSSSCFLPCGKVKIFLHIVWSILCLWLGKPLEFGVPNQIFAGHRDGAL